MIKQILLDQDGVICDFLHGACQAHNRDLDYGESSYGTIETEKVWGITPKEFWAPIDAVPKFWDRLPKMPGADSLVQLAVDLVGAENVAICTAPSTSGDCIPGKRAWIRKNYPQLLNNMIFTSAKQFLASRERVLVDDRDSNIDKFVQAGGYGITVPRLWNRYWRFEQMGWGEDMVQAQLKGLCGQWKG